MKTKHELPFILFSSDVNGHDSLGDIINQSKIVDDLDKMSIKYKQLIGKWKGRNECAYLVPAHHLDDILELVSRYNQTNVLMVDDRRTANLINVSDGTSEYVGTFTRVDEEFALRQDTYTYDVQHDQYWCVR